MKKISIPALLLAFCMIFLLTGCGGSSLPDGIDGEWQADNRMSLEIGDGQFCFSGPDPENPNDPDGDIYLFSVGDITVDKDSGELRFQDSDREDIYYLGSYDEENDLLHFESWVFSRIDYEDQPVDPDNPDNPDPDDPDGPDDPDTPDNPDNPDSDSSDNSSLTVNELGIRNPYGRAPRTPAVSDERTDLDTVPDPVFTGAAAEVTLTGNWYNPSADIFITFDGFGCYLMHENGHSAVVGSYILDDQGYIGLSVFSDEKQASLPDENILFCTGIPGAFCKYSNDTRFVTLGDEKIQKLSGAWALANNDAVQLFIGGKGIYSLTGPDGTVTSGALYIDGDYLMFDNGTDITHAEFSRDLTSISSYAFSEPFIRVQ